MVGKSVKLKEYNNKGNKVAVFSLLCKEREKRLPRLKSSRAKTYFVP